MSEKVNKLMNDSAALRWTALVLIALMMFFAYLFADILSPLKSTLEATRGWDSAIFGTYAGGEYFLNGNPLYRNPFRFTHGYRCRNQIHRRK